MRLEEKSYTEDFPRDPAEGHFWEVLWSGSYQLHAKRNQFKKNLGAPAPPREDARLRPLRGAATRLGTFEKNKLLNS